MGAAIPIIAIATTVLGTAATIRAQQQQSKAASAAASYQSQVASNNQIIADQKAADALQRGKIDERQQRIKTALRIGQANASAAARGVEVGTGSAGDITATLAHVGELDALTARSNAEREAYNFQLQGQQYLSDASLTDLKASNIRSSDKLGIASTTLTGATNVADKWYGYNKTSG